MNQAINVARLVLVCESIEGRKKLQKIVHILQSTGFGRDFPHEFGYLYYGPYSRSLKGDLDTLSSPDVGMIQENEVTAAVGPTYRYSPGPTLSNTFAELGVDNSPPWASRAKELARKDARELEAISTVLYLAQSRQWALEDPRLKAKFAELKPALADRLDGAVSVARRLTTGV